MTYGLRWDLNLLPSSDGELPYAIDGLNDPLTATLAAQEPRLSKRRMRILYLALVLRIHWTKRALLFLEVAWGYFMIWVPAKQFADIPGFRSALYGHHCRSHLLSGRRH